ncbi:MAG TPA: DsbA family protein [Candidatus Dormibacteraeota bacterium]|nr:DsbA family protein [Candidatus Dormibacteraeota bacterium]
MGDSGLNEFDVFYDYLCPYVYRASVLLEGVVASGRELKIGWRYFSLIQVNSKNEGWTVWDAPESEPVKGRLAFKAAEAARRQGGFASLHVPLLRARHRDRLDIDQVEVVERVAEEAGLDMERFRKDVADPGILEPLARDHREGVERYGVFGTPTFVFRDGVAAYVRISEAVEASRAEELFERVLAVAAGEPRILELKRPTRPSPA